jgi:5-methylcytosine-specific restriction endonuclease McrA
MAVKHRGWKGKSWVQRLRERLSEAQNHRCCYCGIRFGKSYYTRCTIEHYQARSHGGRTTFENTVAACCKCNQSRGTSHPMKYWAARTAQIFADQQKQAA